MMKFLWKTFFLLMMVALMNWGSGCGHDEHDHESHQEHREEHDHHDEHDSHDDHSDHEDSVRLSERDMKAFRIELATAQPGSIEKHLSLMGEVVTNANQEAHITPRFPGLVVDVLKEQGDYVQKGDVLALIEANDSLNTYELKSLIEGTVLKKHITKGEVQGDGSVAFVVANLNTVWVDLHVYQKDLPLVHKGSDVVVWAGQGLPSVKANVTYISPIVDEKTRTSVARVDIDNRSGLFKPGMFVSAKVLTSQDRVDVVVSKQALQVVEGRLSVFIQDGEAFKPIPVTVGRQNETDAEILSGLNVGQRYVSQGAFVLKADLAKAAFGDGHNH